MSREQSLDLCLGDGFEGAELQGRGEGLLLREGHASSAGPPTVAPSTRPSVQPGNPHEAEAELKYALVEKAPRAVSGEALTY